LGGTTSSISRPVGRTEPRPIRFHQDGARATDAERRALQLLDRLAGPRPAPSPSPPSCGRDPHGPLTARLVLAHCEPATALRRPGASRVTGPPGGVLHPLDADHHVGDSRSLSALEPVVIPGRTAVWRPRTDRPGYSSPLGHRELFADARLFRGRGASSSAPRRATARPAEVDVGVVAVDVGEGGSGRGVIIVFPRACRTTLPLADVWLSTVIVPAPRPGRTSRCAT